MTSSIQKKLAIFLTLTGLLAGGVVNTGYSYSADDNCFYDNYGHYHCDNYDNYPGYGSYGVWIGGNRFQNRHFDRDFRGQGFRDGFHGGGFHGGGMHGGGGHGGGHGGGGHGGHR